MPKSGTEKGYFATIHGHSNSEQLLTFSKTKREFVDGKILYFDYFLGQEYSKENNRKNHPATFPKDIINFVLDNYFKEGFIVLDSFAGICGIGEEVLKRKGTFIGYDLSKKYLEIGRKRMKNIK